MKDFFISYNRHDRGWAEWIAWTLEAAGYTTVIQAWDFRAGGNFVLDMQKAASEAKQTIAVLSENYLNSKFTQPEWAAAFAQDPTGEQQSLIPIRVGECALTGMWAAIVYVDLVGIEESAAQDVVLQAVQAERTKPQQKPSFPGGTAPVTMRPKPLYPPNLVQNLPYGSQNFVGREVELEQIHQQLHQRSTVVISAISGMGGIGKTELALQYAREHCREGSCPGGVCWLRAREDVGAQIISFVRSLLELTPPDDLELVEKVRWCWGRWREGAVLLIFDDVQRYEDIEPFLPPQDSRFKVLMTTRSHFGGSVQEIQLEVLSEEKAIELLQALVERDCPDLEGFQNLRGLDTAKQICQWLGYLPLGIELVGRYLARKPDTSLETLWQRLQEKRLDAIAFKQAEPGMTASLGVAAAFELSWQELDESAQQLAAVLSLFALVEIPWTLVEQCLPEVDAEELEEIRDRALLGANLLKRVEQGMYQLHQLLREFFASKRSQRADDSALQQKFYQVVIAEAERVIEKPKRSLIEESTIMIAHLQAAIGLLANPEQALNLATCLSWIASLYHEQGRYGEAEPLYMRSLSLREQQLGEDHPNVATVLNNLAFCYRLQGRYAEAETLYVRSLFILEQQLGTDHLHMATTHDNLAELYRVQGRYAEAEPLYFRSLSIKEQQLGADHPDVATVLNNLALLCQEQGYYAKAKPLYIRVLDIYERQLGKNHPYFAQSLNNLAALYQAQGCYVEAEPLYIRALDIREHQLGREHPAVAESLTNLALLYYVQGHYAQAEPLFIRALSIDEHQLGADHPYVATSLNNLAALYQAQGRYARVEPLYTRALDIDERQLGANHPDVAIDLNNLATLYRSQAYYSEAEPLFLRSLSILQNQLPADHPSIARVMSNLAHLYDLQGRYRKAESLYLQALPILSAKLEESHQWRQEASNNWRAFLQKVLQAQRTDELSDDPMTQEMLREINEGGGVWRDGDEG